MDTTAVGHFILWTFHYDLTFQYLKNKETWNMK